MRCAVCGQGMVTEQVSDTVIERGITIYAVPMRYWTCDTCGSDYSDAEQTKANKEQLNAK